MKFTQKPCARKPLKQLTATNCARLFGVQAYESQEQQLTVEIALQDEVSNPGGLLRTKVSFSLHVLLLSISGV